VKAAGGQRVCLAADVVRARLAAQNCPLVSFDAQEPAPSNIVPILRKQPGGISEGDMGASRRAVCQPPPSRNGFSTGQCGCGILVPAGYSFVCPALPVQPGGREADGQRCASNGKGYFKASGVGSIQKNGSGV
jgi:hypothetical protein